MPLQAQPLAEILAMDSRQLTAYFEEYARYYEDAPQRPYAIRVGSETLFSDDTMDLKTQLVKLVRKLKRRKQ